MNCFGPLQTGADGTWPMANGWSVKGGNFLVFPPEDRQWPAWQVTRRRLAVDERKSTVKRRTFVVMSGATDASAESMRLLPLQPATGGGWL